MTVDLAALRAREEELSAIYENVPGIVFYIAVQPDGEFRFLSVSRNFLAATGLGREQVVGSLVRDVIPPPSCDMVLNHYREAIRSGQTVRWEEESVYPVGQKYGEVAVTPLYDAGGLATHLIGIVHDITERKRLALGEMTRKLIQAHEQERARIGRELHDDINQRLAMLALELEQLQENPSELQTRLQDLRNQTTELSNDVQALSHELHSSKLEYLGVVSGIKSWCKEFGERQKMEIDFNSDVSSVMPLDVGVSLFRVLQESLHNAAKHSGVKRLEVQLREVQNEIHLIVTDLGRGFDADAALRGQGLGLTSMQERVRLVNGTIDIESKQMGGTTIRVRVPIESTDGSQRAAG